MDIRLGQFLRARVPGSAPGLRSAVGRAIGDAAVRAKFQATELAKSQAKEQAPRAEAAAASCIEHTRPVWTWIAAEWRRLGTAAAMLLIVGLLLHAMFGDNGVVIYRQKRSETQSLRSEVELLQKENDLYVDQIKSLKSDPAAIEKEAREQLHYTRPGEIVYVTPDLPQKTTNGRPNKDRATNDRAKNETKK